MAVATESFTSLPLAEPPSASYPSLPASYDHPRTVNELFIRNVAKYGNSPCLGYPATDRGKADYVYYSFHQLNGLVDKAAAHYAESGLVLEVSFAHHPVRSS